MYTDCFRGYRYLANGAEVLLANYSLGEGDEQFIPQPHDIPNEVTSLEGRLVRVVVRLSAGSCLSALDFFHYTTQIGLVYQANWTLESARVIFHTIPDTLECFTKLLHKGYEVALVTIIH